MKNNLKILGYGIIAWLGPFIVSLLFFSRNGEPLFDIFLIKTILLVIFGFLGSLLLVLYFRNTNSDFICEGIKVGLGWLFINWILDIAILMPLAKMDFTTYFTQIGLRYFLIPAMSIAMGYIMEHQHRKKPAI